MLCFRTEDQISFGGREPFFTYFYFVWFFFLRPDDLCDLCVCVCLSADRVTSCLGTVGCGGGGTGWQGSQRTWLTPPTALAHRKPLAPPPCICPSPCFPTSRLLFRLRQCAEYLPISGVRGGGVPDCDMQDRNNIFKKLILGRILNTFY